MKSQSAMEYLMTYGWAILIIAVVLGVLFQLGVFSGSALAPRAQPGSCTVQRFAGQVSLEGICQGQLPQFVAQFTGFGYIFTANQIAYPSGSQPRTLLGWYYTSGQATGGYAIASYGYSSPFNAVYPFIRPTSQALVTTFDSDLVVCGACAIPGSWQFIAETYNGIAESGYVGVGGTIFSATQVATATTPSSTELFIGQNPDNGNRFIGALANIQLYNTSLSANEVQALYLEGIGGAPIKIQNLVGWWPLNGNLNDYSGNNNNGQVYGSISFNGTWQSGYTPP